MTIMQICALIIAILFIGLTYWSGYRGGLSDGHSNGYDEGCLAGFTDGLEEGKLIQRSDSRGEIRDLELLLAQARENHDKLYVHYQRAVQASKLSTDDRNTLLATAKQLHLAAETFLALKASTKATNARALRTKILAIAALLEQAEQETAA